MVSGPLLCCQLSEEEDVFIVQPTGTIYGPDGVTPSWGLIHPLLNQGRVSKLSPKPSEAHGHLSVLFYA